MIAVNTEITSSRVKVNAITDAEILWIKVHCQGHKDILIAACYRPDVSDKVTSVELRESLTELSTNRKRAFGIIVGGDFNYPGCGPTSGIRRHFGRFWIDTARYRTN